MRNRNLGLLPLIGVASLVRAGPVEKVVVVDDDYSAPPKRDRRPTTKGRVRMVHDEQRIRLAERKRLLKGARLLMLVERGGFRGSGQ